MTNMLLVLLIVLMIGQLIAVWRIGRMLIYLATMVGEMWDDLQGEINDY